MCNTESAVVSEAVTVQPVVILFVLIIIWQFHGTTVLGAARIWSKKFSFTIRRPSHVHEAEVIAGTYDRCTGIGFFLCVPEGH